MNRGQAYREVGDAEGALKAMRRMRRGGVEPDQVCVRACVRARVCACVGDCI